MRGDLRTAGGGRGKPGPALQTWENMMKSEQGGKNQMSAPGRARKTKKRWKNGRIKKQVGKAEKEKGGERSLEKGGKRTSIPKAKGEGAPRRGAGGTLQKAQEGVSKKILKPPIRPGGEKKGKQN